VGRSALKAAVRILFASSFAIAAVTFTSASSLLAAAKERSYVCCSEPSHYSECYSEE
jgi:hypothetical protein